MLRRRNKRGNAKGSGPADYLIVGLGNPGSKYAGTRHNIGFEVASAVADRWQLPRAKQRYLGLITRGRAGTSGPSVAVLLPQTYMNETGRSIGPAAGALKVLPQRVVVIHDEIDLPFGEVQSRLGGGLAGHNGLRSVRDGLGSSDFQRIRVGVGRPDSTDPEIVSAYVLSAFKESKQEVRELVMKAAEATAVAVLEQPT